MKALFLYTELAHYFLTCVGELLRRGVEVHIVRYPVNKEAPFKFEFSENIHVYEKSEYSGSELFSLCKNINPDVIYCAGWVEKDYLSVCKFFNHKIPVIVGLDNQWNGSFKQRIACLASPFFIKKYFSHCWPAGELQYKFARKLGFKEENIIIGLYMADVNSFNRMYQNSLPKKKLNFPKRFIYIGRYYEFKGIKELWDAFIEMDNELNTDWELWCLGTGDVEPVVHPKIKHFGFVQPNEMEKFIAETGVFILPSHFEPWGVVVHEFASAGFPLVVTDEVGSRTAFVEHGYNGYIYRSSDKNALKNLMIKIVNLSTDELLLMGSRSIEKAMKYTPSKWANNLISLVKK